MVVFNEDKQNKRLAALRQKEEEDSVVRTAGKLGIPYIDLTGMIIETDALATIPEEESKKAQMAGFKIVGKNLYISLLDIKNPQVKTVLERLKGDGYNVSIYLVSQFSLDKAWDRYSDIQNTSKSRSSFLDISQDALEKISQNIKNNSDIKSEFNSLIAKSDIRLVTQVVELILGSAIATDSSDIHIEPENEEVFVRFRQDGELHTILSFPLKLYKKINSRIKILSKLKLTQQAQAQDGRFTIDFKNKEIEIRVSMAPGAYGESVVMRILNPDAISVELSSLGINKKLLQKVREVIHKPNGLVLTTGPTGSGKTTTLYAFLKDIYSPGTKILTIEDPIEYHLSGVTQTQVNKNKGYTFSKGLRGALRQDPDVIMVGEIRDDETAQTAIDASLTGHIVLSTLHTNNAAGAIPRLIDLHINPKILPSSVTLTLAQRLIRKLIPECKEEYKPTPEIENIIRDILRNAEKNGKNLEEFGISSNQDITLYRPGKDCSIGNGTGYKGRIGIFEAILMDSSIEDLITHNPSEREIRKIADSQGYLTMQEDGVIKALQGLTSIEEVSRVVDLSEGLDDLKKTIPPNPSPAVKNIEQSKPVYVKENITSNRTSTQISIDNKLDGLVGELNSLKETTERIDSNLSQDTKQPSLDELIQRPMSKEDTLADHIRDTEIILLLERIKELEERQQAEHSESISSEIQNITNAIIAIMQRNPPKPKLTIDAEGNIVKQEIKALLDELLFTTKRV